MVYVVEHKFVLIKVLFGVFMCGSTVILKSPKSVYRCCYCTCQISEFKPCNVRETTVLGTDMMRRANVEILSLNTLF